MVKKLHSLSALVGLGEGGTRFCFQKNQCQKPGREKTKSKGLGDHGIIQEKPSKIIKSNHYSSTAKATTKPWLHVPHLFAFDHFQGQ